MVSSDPSVLKKYFYEVCLIALASAVVYLFMELSRLQVFIRETLIKQQIETTVTLRQTNELIQRLNDTGSGQIR